MESFDSQPKNVAESFNTLGMRIFSCLPDEENVFLSPISIACAICMLLLGARGTTAKEVSDSLDLSLQNSVDLDVVGRLLRQLSTRTITDASWDEQTGEAKHFERSVFQLHIANGLFAHEKLPLRRQFVKTVQSALGASVLPVDLSAPEKSAEVVNEWIDTNTNGKIRQILTPENITPITQLIAANATYFFAEWQDQFDDAKTKSKPFYSSAKSENSCDVQMMHQNLLLGYMADIEVGYEAVSIPYKEMSMLILLPAPGRLPEVEVELSAETISEVLNKLSYNEVNLQLPKFEMESSIQLSPILSELGMLSAFDPDTANFAGILDSPDPVAISDMMHRARIAVDEFGTEAAAATAIVWALAEPESHKPKPIEFVVDRPFLFLIRDDKTGSILFLGRMVHPDSSC